MPIGTPVLHVVNRAAADGSNGTVILDGLLWRAGHDVKPAADRRD